MRITTPVGLGSLPVSWSSPWLGRDSRCTALLVCRAGQGSCKAAMACGRDERQAPPVGLTCHWSELPSSTRLVGRGAVGRPSGTAGRSDQCAPQHPAASGLFRPRALWFACSPRGRQLCHPVLAPLHPSSQPVFRLHHFHSCLCPCFGIYGLLGHLHGCLCMLLQIVVTFRFASCVVVTSS